MVNVYDLPTSVEIDGKEYPIRTDFRAALDIIFALNDPDLNDNERAGVLLRIFYPQDIPENVQEAVAKCFWFLSCGDDNKDSTQRPKMMDWEQDFPIIVGAVNAVAGKEVRAEKSLHWWTFIGYYQNIGDCTFATVVSIRKKLKKGQKLDNSEREFYRNNREMVDFKTRYSSDEEALLKALGV
ncbi:MAG: hypothetical protein KBS75_09375 [Bacteroidales bacterium]|nr:hypothetical protein [Candidatus Equimonas faecalis]